MDTATDPVAISFDWDPTAADDCITFHAIIDRGDRHSAFDITINLRRLGQPHLDALKIVLERRQQNLSKAPELTTTIRWLLGIGLAQEGLGPEERDARIRELMLGVPEPLQVSPKESLFEAQNTGFLQQAGLKDFYEEIKTLSCYPEVHRSWRQAVRAFNVGTPKLPSDSIDEADELELFFLRLRFESMPTAFSAHAALTGKWSSNPLFRAAVSETIARAPDQKEMPLDYYILCAWMSSCLWLLTNEDRAKMLNVVYRVTLVADDGIRKAVKRLGLKDWTDFQPQGTAAPYTVKVWAQDGQEWCQIVLKKLADRNNETDSASFPGPG